MSAGVDVLSVMDRDAEAAMNSTRALCGRNAADRWAHDSSNAREAVAALIESAPAALSHLTGDAKRWYGLQNVANKSRAALLREEADFIESGERAIARFRAALARCQP